MESRLRQLEGKLLGSASAQPRGKAEPQKYDAGRQGASGALLTAPKAYNADADVVMEPAKPDKKVSNALVVFLCYVMLRCQRKQLGLAKVVCMQTFKNSPPCIPVLRNPVKQLWCGNAADILWTSCWDLE